MLTAGRGLRGDVGEACVGEDRLGLAVAQDVGDLVGGDVPVDRREANAGSAALLAAPRRTPAGCEQSNATLSPGPMPAARSVRATWLARALSSANVRLPCAETIAGTSGCNSPHSELSVPVRIARSMTFGRRRHRACRSAAPSTNPGPSCPGTLASACRADQAGRQTGANLHRRSTESGSRLANHPLFRKGFDGCLPVAS